MKKRYVRASELNSFSFCRRAWFLERQGLTSTLQEERARGASDHALHREAVSTAANTGRAARLLLIIGAAGLAVAICWLLTR